MKTKTDQWVEDLEQELIALARDIHEHPETAYEEHYASQRITELLEAHGFDVERRVAGIDTAFLAHYGSGKPRIAYIAEYDALKNIGHGCGHNLIAAMSVGAALALSKENLPCSISVIGTPAEEGGGGKVIMSQQGIFDDYDVAMMIHPASENLIQRGGLATRNLEVEYFGKSAHSAIPESGINALTALINTFQAFYQMQSLFPMGSTFNGIIQEGGVASNVIPDYAKGRFSVRAKTIKDLRFILDKMSAAVEAINQLIGTTSKISMTPTYAERYPNLSLELRLKDHLEELGITMNYPKPNMKVGSSDIGNVSLIIPTIHSYLAMIPEGVNAHSTSFAQHAMEPLALERMIIGAKALARTGRDVAMDKGFLEKIREDFAHQVPHYEKEELFW